MAQPAIRQSTYATVPGGSGGTILTLGLAPVAGNLLFLLEYGKNGLFTSSITPAGWTIDMQDQGFGPAVTFQSWGFSHKVAGVSEPSSITVTRNSNFDITFYSLFEITNVTSWNNWYTAAATTQAGIAINSWPSSVLPQLVISGIASGNSGGPQAASNWNGWHQDHVFSATFHSGENFYGSSFDGLSIPPTFVAGGSEAGVVGFKFFGTATNTQPIVNAQVC